MNLIMFGYFAGTSAFGELTDISIRDLMFQQRMQEIENDVLNWGFVDDGLDNISHPALTSDQWQIESPDQEWMVQNWDGANL
jgi:hypothetical protein